MLQGLDLIAVGAALQQCPGVIAARTGNQRRRLHPFMSRQRVGKVANCLIRSSERQCEQTEVPRRRTEADHGVAAHDVCLGMRL